MSLSINTIIVAGNATKDAEIKIVQGSHKVATFNVATSEGGYKTKDGKDIPEQTQFHRVVAWRGLAELCEKAIKKGTQVMVEGKMTYRTWFDDAQTQTGRHDAAEILASNIVIGSSRSQSVSVEQQEAPIAIPVDMAQNANMGNMASDDLPFEGGSSTDVEVF